MEVLRMGYTTGRHSQLGGILLSELWNLLRKGILGNKTFISQGTTRLCYEGERFTPFVNLINVSETPSVDFLKYDSVEPDLFLFHRQPYVRDGTGRHFAGNPDLIIEIWSESNREEERSWKKLLYSTAADTEHWYFEQNSDVVERWIGKTQLSSVTYKEKLQTVSGLELDISDVGRYLLE
ncbi:MAG: Uma2 family endonuclease [Turicibacter sp.]|nr:Uma2 family endonuclease [Turicibacter sp.]